MTQFKFIHLLLIIALIFTLGISLLWFFQTYVPEPFPSVESYSILLIYLIMVSITVAVFKNTNLMFIHQQIGFRSFKLKYIYIAVLASISIWAFDYFYQSQFLVNDLSIDAYGWRGKNNNLTIAFISTVVFAPIIEEMLLRGIFLQTANQYLSKFWSAFIISLIFAAVHLSWVDAVPLFMASMFYAWLRFKSNSIVPAIIAHILNNCFTFIYYLLLIKVI